MSDRGAWLVGGLDPRACASLHRLHAAVARFEDRGAVLPCRVPSRAHWWTSEDRADREAATHGCRACPLLDVCREHAAAERAHVWAGLDRTPTHQREEVSA